MTRFQPQTEIKLTISDEQKQNIEILIKDIQNSVDVPLSEIDFSQLRSDIKSAFSDRILTSDELEIIISDVTDIINIAEITPTEARTIFYDLQNIGETSCLPRTDDNLTGTSANDIFWSGLGNDTLTGADLSTAGVGEKDTLIGGGGNDTFVLGDSITAFYNDNNSLTVGSNDYALIVDYNPDQDIIQLHGDASNYTLGELSQLGVNGTGIFYKGDSDSFSTPELIGIVAGVNLTDFSSGFTFV